MFVQAGRGTLRDVYKIGKVIGQGTFGEVRKCKHRQMKLHRAVKIIKKDLLSRLDRKQLLNEMTILKHLDHPNIVKIYEYFEDPLRFYIVTDIVEGGELFDEIVRRGNLSETDAA
jgi:calcium-dependent protein kinase